MTRASVAKLLIFSMVTTAIVYALGLRNLYQSFGVGFFVGFCLLFCFDTWRGKRDQREMRRRFQTGDQSP